MRRVVGWMAGRAAEWIRMYTGEKNANGESGGNDGRGRNIEWEKAKGREEMVEGWKEGEEGIAEKRQEGGYSRLHPRGSGPSVSPWQPTLKHPPAVALPSHRRELRFPMAVIMYPRSRCTHARCWCRSQDAVHTARAGAQCTQPFPPPRRLRAGERAFRAVPGPPRYRVRREIKARCTTVVSSYHTTRRVFRAGYLPGVQAPAALLSLWLIIRSIWYQSTFL